MGNLKKFIGETLIYGFANVFSRVFAMMLIPIYANTLSKTTYSNLIMLQSVFSVLTFLLALNSGVFFYYYEYERVRYRKIIFTSWFYYQLMTAILLSLLLVVFSGPLTELFIVTEDNSWELGVSLMLIGLQFFPYILNITNINLFRIDRTPKKVMYITLLEAIFTLLLVWVGIKFFGFGMIGIVCMQILARLIVAILFIKSASFYFNAFHFSKNMLKKLFVFSWPFFIISAFSWAIISLDKFLGADLLTNKDDVAYLALAMQLSLPIAVLADMIRMAIGPFVMSIRKEKDADQSYQRIFDLSVYSGMMVLVLLVVFSPLLVNILANESYLMVLKVLPFIALGSILSLIANQFAISFSLVKKNVYILYATVLGGVIGFLVNYFYMTDHGFIIAGISQILSYALMASFLYIFGKRKTDLNLNLTQALVMLLMIGGFIGFIYWDIQQILDGNYLKMILSGCGVLVLLTALYFYFQKLTVKGILSAIKNRG